MPLLCCSLSSQEPKIQKTRTAKSAATTDGNRTKKYRLHRGHLTHLGDCQRINTRMSPKATRNPACSNCRCLHTGVATALALHIKLVSAWSLNTMDLDCCTRAQKIHKDLFGVTLCNRALRPCSVRFASLQAK